MKIVYALKDGLSRLRPSINAVLIVWFTFLVVAILVAYPVKQTILSGFGSSLITEKMSEGFNIEAYSDLGPLLKSLASQAWGGFLVTLLAGFLLDAFFAGGLFSIVRKNGNASAGNFFFNCAATFWSNVVILFIISTILLFTGIVFILVPLGISGAGQDLPDISVLKAGLSGFGFFLLFVLPLLIIVADYARAWQSSNNGNKPFKALGFGFSQMFRTFLSSWLIMLIILIIQILYLVLFLTIIPYMTPSDGKGVFYLFLISQLMVAGRLFIKVFRYGAITSLYEQELVKRDEINYNRYL